MRRASALLVAAHLLTSRLPWGCSQLLPPLAPESRVIVIDTHRPYHLDNVSRRNNQVSLKRWPSLGVVGHLLLLRTAREGCAESNRHGRLMSGLCFPLMWVLF
jgi:hypothetical protein